MKILTVIDRFYVFADNGPNDAVRRPVLFAKREGVMRVGKVTSVSMATDGRSRNGLYWLQSDLKFLILLVNEVLLFSDEDSFLFLIMDSLVIDLRAFWLSEAKHPQTFILIITIIAAALLYSKKVSLAKATNFTLKPS